jgi:hypothetical protein
VTVRALEPRLRVALAHVHAAARHAVRDRRMAVRALEAGPSRGRGRQVHVERGGGVAVRLREVAALEVVAAACPGVAVQAGVLARLAEIHGGLEQRHRHLRRVGYEPEVRADLLEGPLVGGRVADQAVDVLELRLVVGRRRPRAQAGVAARAPSVQDQPAAVGGVQLAEPVDVGVDAEVVDPSHLARGLRAEAGRVGRVTRPLVVHRAMEGDRLVPVADQASPGALEGGEAPRVRPGNGRRVRDRDRQRGGPGDAAGRVGRADDQGLIARHRGGRQHAARDRRVRRALAPRGCRRDALRGAIRVRRGGRIGRRAALHHRRRPGNGETAEASRRRSAITGRRCAGDDPLGARRALRGAHAAGHGAEILEGCSPAPVAPDLRGPDHPAGCGIRDRDGRFGRSHPRDVEPPAAPRCAGDGQARSDGRGRGDAQERDDDRNDVRP